MKNKFLILLLIIFILLGVFFQKALKKENENHIKLEEPFSRIDMHYCEYVNGVDDKLYYDEHSQRPFKLYKILKGKKPKSNFLSLKENWILNFEEDKDSTILIFIGTINYFDVTIVLDLNFDSKTKQYTIRNVFSFENQHTPPIIERESGIFRGNLISDDSCVYFDVLLKNKKSEQYFGSKDRRYIDIFVRLSFPIESFLFKVIPKEYFLKTSSYIVEFRDK